MDMETTTFTPVESTLTGVSEYAADFLNGKLVKVNKRLAKLGAPAATLTFGPLVEKTERDDWTGFTRTWREFETVTVTGVEAKFAGWRGIATFDWTLDPVEALVSKFPGAEEVTFPDEFRFRGPTCDHCGKIRSRNITVLFLSEDDGRWMVVGTSCCRDFIGVDPSTVLWLAAPAFGGSEDDDEMRGGGGRFETAPIEFLAAAAECTRLFGFVKSRPDTAYDEPTKNAASTLTRGRLTDFDKKRFAEVDYKRGFAEAEKIMAWVEASDDWSDFMRSAKLACRTWKVTDKTTGLLAALPFSYMKAMGKLAERKAVAAADDKPTDFLGTVGSKLTVEGVVTFMMAFEPYAYNGPTPYRLTIVTDSGHTVTTKGSGSTLCDAAVGYRVLWTGKVVGLEDHEKFGKRTECKLVKISVLGDADGNPIPKCTGWCETCANSVFDGATHCGFCPGSPGYVAPPPPPPVVRYDPLIEDSYNAALAVGETKGLPYSAKTATALVNWVWGMTESDPDTRLAAIRGFGR